MFKNVVFDYRTTRAFQICVVFITTLAIQRYLQFSHAGWIGFSVMMIYAGFDSGTSIHRTQHRFWGALFGLFLSYILWFMIRIHFELIFLVIPCIVFLAFFNLGGFYASPTVFTVTLTAMGTEYYGVDSYPVDVFFFDYFRSTVIALSICVFFEFFIFKKKNLTHKFYFDLQNALISKLDGLFCIVTRNPIRQSQYLKISAQLNVNILELNTFFITVQHDYHIAAYHFRDLDTFNRLVEQTYQNIRQLFVIGTESPANLTAETRVMLDQLFELSQEQRQGDVMCSPNSSA